MWELDPGWAVIETGDAGIGYVQTCAINHYPRGKYILYKGTEVWTLGNGRCRQITYHRFEKDLLKALKLAQKFQFKQREDYDFETYLVFRDSDETILSICDVYMDKLTKLGLYGEKGFVVPKKLTKKQVEFAIAEWPRIVYRIKKAEAYLAKQKRQNR
jgi:hypothetical protein